MRLFVISTVRRPQGRAQRSEVEIRNEVKNFERKSGFMPSLLFIRSQISPLRTAMQPYGRDDKGADFNHNCYKSSLYPHHKIGE